MDIVIGTIILALFWAALAWFFFHLQEPSKETPLHWYRGRRR